MIVRLAVRSLTTRPLRTAVLAAGFGFGIAIMAALLGVGDVILEQAHAPALQGGGDLVVAGAFGPIESARFLLSSVLTSPDFGRRTAAASPSRRATLYLLKPGMSIATDVRGGIPSRERAVGDPEIIQIPNWNDAPADANWSNPSPGDVLRAMDRFHPIPDAAEGQSSWAEWLYFNGRTADGRLRFYLTFLAGPLNAADKRPAIVRLQIDRDGRSANYSAGADVDHATLLERAPDIDIGDNRVRLDGLRYRMTLALKGERGRETQGRVLSVGLESPEGARPYLTPDLTGEIILDALPGRSLPPAAIRGAKGWLSGYVVPVLAGTVTGTLKIGREVISLDGAIGYHDHNWGFWEGVRWQWGQVAHGDLSFVYGRVSPPASVADPDRIPGFLGVMGRDGPIAFSTEVSIAEDDNGGSPHATTVHARGQQLEVRLEFSVEESVRTRLPMTRRPGSPAMDFLQLGGTYRVTGRARDRTIDFTARGAAETFRPGRLH